MSKKVYNVKLLVSVNDNEREYIDIRKKNLQYLDLSNTMPKLIKTTNFIEAGNIAQKYIVNSNFYKTAFKHRPVLQFTIRPDFWVTNKYRLTEKNFYSLKIKKEYKEVTNYSIYELSCMLRGDVFCEYMKNHGISIYEE